MVDGGREFTLAHRSIVGRARTCSVQLEDPTVSGEHARFAWTDVGWTVRDLASRNGTTVDGERLTPGSDAALRRGSRLTFGLGERTGTWELVDDGPPTATARVEGRTAAAQSAEGGLLALPSATDPQVLIYREAGRWVLESSEGETSTVLDGDPIDVSGERFVLSLPDAHVETAEAHHECSIHDAGLSFLVSRDGEHVELEVTRRTESERLPPRTYHHTLLVLARARLEDRATLELSESECGWVYVESLPLMVGRAAGHLNVDVFRARRDFASLGFSNAHALIERRSQSRQLRIGCLDLSIRPL